jgi:NADPH-dependent curcumin reductase CurA
MATINRQIRLVSRPSGEAEAGNFCLVEQPLSEPGDGQVLVRHHYLSLDPYMRGRMNDAKSYAQPQPLDKVMQGGTVGVVVKSKHPGYAEGDSVVGFGGWQGTVVDAGVPGRCARSTRRTFRSRRISARWACRACGVVRPDPSVRPGRPDDRRQRRGGAVGGAVGQLAKTRGTAPSVSPAA